MRKGLQQALVALLLLLLAGSCRHEPSLPRSELGVSDAAADVAPRDDAKTPTLDGGVDGTRQPCPSSENWTDILGDLIAYEGDVYRVLLKRDSSQVQFHQIVGDSFIEVMLAQLPGSPPVLLSQLAAEYDGTNLHLLRGRNGSSSAMVDHFKGDSVGWKPITIETSGPVNYTHIDALALAQHGGLVYGSVYATTTSKSIRMRYRSDHVCSTVDAPRTDTTRVSLAVSAEQIVESWTDGFGAHAHAFANSGPTSYCGQPRQTVEYKSAPQHSEQPLAVLSVGTAILGMGEDVDVSVDLLPSNGSAVQRNAAIAGTKPYLRSLAAMAADPAQQKVFLALLITPNAAIYSGSGDGNMTRGKSVQLPNEFNVTPELAYSRIAVDDARVHLLSFDGSKLYYQCFARDP
ncbi:MAG: hypothetical protein KC503_09005 [Myxococcales bacterium]|nr:hypothetical protein [Myxococcales bacterium]